MKYRALLSLNYNPRISIQFFIYNIFKTTNYCLLWQVEIRPMMYVALTYDHRLIDGREAVTFLRKVKAVVEDPRVLLLGM